MVGKTLGHYEITSQLGKVFDHPQILPDGRSVLFTRILPGPTKVLVQSLKSGERKELFEGYAACYLPTGHIFYASGNSLFAIGFDFDLLKVKGGPITMAEGVINGEAVMAVPVKTNPTFSLETPRTLFRGTYVSYLNNDFHPWDISPDGKRFLMMKESGLAGEGSAGPRRINIVLNWTEELKQRVPVK